MSEPSAAPAINEEKMQAFMGKVVTDFGASLSVILSYMGTKLGLYDALGASNGMTSAELAEKTGTNERYVREWLVNQAAGEYVHYDPATAKFSLLPEQKVALTDEASPFYVAGGFYAMKAMLNAQPRILDSFKNGGGMLWGEHDPDLFVGTEKFFRPGYTGFLTASWIPALTGIEEKLKAGAKVADVGCGHGASTIIMAKTYPDSKFFGFDTHPASIETATKRAADAGVSDRVSFTVCSASDIPTEGFDLITFFDCLHDMGDPHGAAKRAFKALNDGGSCMIVEPMAGENVEDNFNPIGRTFSGASSLCCTANSMAQGGPALGAVASDSALREVVTSGGFAHFGRATETPFNRVFEARK